MAIPSMLLHYFNSFKLFSAYIASLHFLFVIPPARKVICQLNKIDAKAPHHTQMHVISLIDNATFFKPITLEYILSEDQELVRPKLLARSALEALQDNDVSITADASGGRRFYNMSPRQRHLQGWYASCPVMVDSISIWLMPALRRTLPVPAEKMFCIAYDRFCAKANNEQL